MTHTQSFFSSVVKWRHHANRPFEKSKCLGLTIPKNLFVRCFYTVSALWPELTFKDSARFQLIEKTRSSARGIDEPASGNAIMETQYAITKHEICINNSNKPYLAPPPPPPLLRIRHKWGFTRTLCRCMKVVRGEGWVAQLRNEETVVLRRWEI